MDSKEIEELAALPVSSLDKKLKDLRSDMIREDFLTIARKIELGYKSAVEKDKVVKKHIKQSDTLKFICIIDEEHDNYLEWIETQGIHKATAARLGLTQVMKADKDYQKFLKENS